MSCCLQGVTVFLLTLQKIRNVARDMNDIMLVRNYYEKGKCTENLNSIIAMNMRYLPILLI